MADVQVQGVVPVTMDGLGQFVLSVSLIISVSAQAELIVSRMHPTLCQWEVCLPRALFMLYRMDWINM